ncbi:hypothetical protein H0H87_001920 [Tephrocybe sp. NHM501043]|nr:hypothetical protein H0H87_001920 [Tephrocybe sp. NHM501043]
MLSQHHARTEKDIDTLRRGVLHHHSQGNDLLREIRVRFLQNEDARREEFRRARKERQDEFADLVVDRKDHHARCNSWYDSTFEKCMQKWTKILHSNANERTLALEDEERLWTGASVTLNRIFDEAQVLVRKESSRITGIYAEKQLHREMQLHTLGSQLQAETNKGGFVHRTNNIWSNPQQVRVEDNPGVQAGGAFHWQDSERQPAFKSVWQLQDVQRQGQGRGAQILSQATPEFGKSESGINGQGENMGCEVKCLSTHRDREVALPLPTDLAYNNGNSNIIPETSSTLAKDDDEEHTRDTMFLAAIDDDDQRWKGAIDSLEEDAERMRSLFNNTFLDLMQQYNRNRLREGNDAGIDLSLLYDTRKWRRADFEEKDRQRQEVYNACLLAYCSGWREQLETQEEKFRQLFVVPAFRICEYLANALISIRAEQNAHARQLFTAYQPFFRDGMWTMALNQQTDRVVDGVAAQGWYPAGGEEAASYSVYPADAFCFQGNSPQQPYSILDVPLTESPLLLTDPASFPDALQEPSVRKTSDVFGGLLMESPFAVGCRLPTNPIDLQQVQIIGADFDLERLGFHDEPNPSNANAQDINPQASHDKAAFKPVSGLRRFASGLSYIWSFPCNLLSSFVVWTSRLAQHAIWEKNQSQRVFRERQAQRQHVLINQTLERTLSISRISANLQRLFEHEQVVRREYALQQEAERNDNFRCLEGERQRKYDKHVRSFWRKDKRENEWQGQTFFCRQSKRRIQVKKCMKRMQDELFESQHHRKQFISDLPARMERMIYEQLHQFETEERQRDQCVESIYRYYNKTNLPDLAHFNFAS